MEWLFQVGIVAALVLVIWDQGNKWVAMFLALAFVSSIIPASTKFSTGAFRLILLGAIWYLAIVLAAQYFTDTKRLIDYLMLGMAVVALSNIGMLVLQTFNIDPIFTPVGGPDSPNPPVGLLSNQNEVSGLLAFTFPVFLRRKWRWGIPVVFAGVLMSRSQGGLLAISTGLLVYAIFQAKARGYIGSYFSIYPAIAILAFMAMAVVLAILFDRDSIDARVTAWREYLSLYFKQGTTRIFIGFGIGHWKMITEKVRVMARPTWWKTAHNEYVQGLFEMSPAFLVILGGYLSSIFIRLKRAAKELDYSCFKKQILDPVIIPVVALVAIITNSFVHFGFHIAPTALIGITWLAILEVRLRACEE
jgi:hypothetical protein